MSDMNRRGFLQAIAAAGAALGSGAASPGYLRSFLGMATANPQLLTGKWVVFNVGELGPAARAMYQALFRAWAYKDWIGLEHRLSHCAITLPTGATVHLLEAGP